MPLRSKFIGRETELAELGRFLRKRTASFIVINGRRRVGKSRLVVEFAKRNHLELLTYVGLPPDDKVTAQDQRDFFARQLGLVTAQISDWADLFNLLGDKIKTGRKLVLLDEISWMAMNDPTFLGKLKTAWDTVFSSNPELILILCGSVSSWIEKNILSSTGFVGRVSFALHLQEMPLCDCNEFWNGARGKIAAYEKFKILSVVGGIPRYLEEMDPTLTAEENIKNLCFKKGGLLYREFGQMFHELFRKRGDIYQRLIKKILGGRFGYDEIYQKLGIAKTGTISEYLTDLEQAGFIRRDYTWDIASGKQAKFSKYRISDNYIRFYLKYIAPNADKIERGVFLERSLLSLPGWETIMGLQFENLVLTNRQAIYKKLHIRIEDILYDNPFFQTKTTKRDGCQIDYLIQTRFKTLYVCEIKFKKDQIHVDIIKELELKIKRLKIPRYVSIRPVLIHVNGVSDALLDARYFAEIINFSEMLSK